MSLTLREIKLLKQRRKKSGPPCGVDFKRELTSSVLTSRGFHCISSHALCVYDYVLLLHVFLFIHTCSSMSI